MSPSFRLLKFYKHVMPCQRDMSTQMLSANEITEPLTFTVRKVELHG